MIRLEGTGKRIKLALSAISDRRAMNNKRKAESGGERARDKLQDRISGILNSFINPTILNTANANMPTYAEFIDDDSVRHLLKRDLGDTEYFIARSCESLISQLGVYNVWIALADGDQVTLMASSFEKSFLPFRDFVASGQMPYCIHEAMRQNRLVTISDPKTTCGKCPLASRYSGRVGLVSPIQYEGHIFGVLCVSAPEFTANDAEMKDQFDRAALQIGQILYLANERRIMEMELRESRRQLSSIMNSLPGMAYRCRCDPEWTMEFVSSGCIELTGYQPDELIGNQAISYAQLIVPEDRQMVKEAINKAIGEQQSYTLEYRIVNSRGEERWVWEKGHAVQLRDQNESRLEGFITDITERLKMEKRLVQMQKNESLAVMAGGMAHDFNNILMLIEGSAELARQEVGNDSPVASFLNKINESTRNAAQLCRRMLAFSGRSSVVIDSLHINHVLEAARPLIKSISSSDVNVEYEMGADIPAFMADASDVQQVILQLVKNGIEACGGKGGTVRIKTGSEYFDGRPVTNLVMDEDPPSGWHVFISIADNGCGMDASMIGKLFDPFFTTKFTGRGMGLPAVRGIVRSCKGKLLLTSRLERGTTIKVLFPVSTTMRAKSTNGPASLNPIKHKPIKTVMVVDDEPGLRLISRKILEMAGYSVTTAEDGAAAVDYYRIHPGEIDVILMDLTMPRMDGAEAIRQIKEINPGARIILTTGYSEIDVEKKIGMSQLSGVLLKPYTKNDLIQQIEKAGAFPPGDVS